MSNANKTLINKIFSWSLVKGSGDVGIDESIFLNGIVLIANGEDSDGEETSIIEARVILGEQDSEIIIHREEELFDEWEPEISDGIINKVYDS